jgi:ubiquinone/menaquinone biosynthesis C-methylase UbiE
MTQLEFMNAVRTEGIRKVLQTHGDLFAGKDLLEIGSGTGAQLLVLRDVCRSATGIEIADRWYRSSPLVEIVQYDGRRIPFQNASFDVIFSSNVIEHIRDENTIHAEMHRVLRPGGVCFHIVPSAMWRIVASIAHYPASIKGGFQRLLGRRVSRSETSANDPGPVTLDRWIARLKFGLVPPRHGEFGNWLTEHLFIFRAGTWRKRFETQGWQIESMGPVGFFHTGCYLFGKHLSWRTRIWLGKFIGSSELFFVLRTASNPADPHRH